VGVDHDEWCGDLPSRVLTGLMMQVIIEFSSAREKHRTVVKGGERFYLIPWISRHASPLGDPFTILPSGASQYGTRARRIQNGVCERLCLARRQDQHGAFLDRTLSGGFGAVEDKIGHCAAFQVCRALNQELLLLIQASVEPISFRGWHPRCLSPSRLCGLAHIS
jgi:hypothetical protein